MRQSYGWPQRRSAFRIPAWWCPQWVSDIPLHVSWYEQRYGIRIGRAARDAWAELAGSIHCWPGLSERSVRLYAVAQDRCPADLVHINVHEKGLNAKRSHLYAMTETTGVDFALQAVLVAQKGTAEVLHQAYEQIEREHLEYFGFVCAHGTHRSVGCCVILAMLIFPKATICMTTARTSHAAERYGMVMVDE